MSRVINSNYCLGLVAFVLLCHSTCSVPTSSSSTPPPSPCPSLFSYKFDKNQSVYHGLVNLQSQTLKNSAEVEMSFSLATQLPSSYVGSIETIGENRQLIDQISKGRGISYRVNLPVQTPLPRLTKLTLNGRELCSGPSEKGSFVTEITLRHFIRADANNWKLPATSNGNKNVAPIAASNIGGGHKTVAGGLPKNDPADLQLVTHREQSETEEETAHEISPNQNSTSYKVVTKTVTYKEYVSKPQPVLKKSV